MRCGSLYDAEKRPRRVAFPDLGTMTDCAIPDAVCRIVGKAPTLIETTLFSSFHFLHYCRCSHPSLVEGFVMGNSSAIHGPIELSFSPPPHTRAVAPTFTTD